MRCAALLCALLMPAMAQAAPPGPRDPDWPCQQIKVSELSYGTVWNGPALDSYLRTWSDDPAVAALVARLAQRRVPLDRAQAEIAAFAQTSGAQRGTRLTILMAGLFDTLDQERASVLAGLDRYGRRQRSFAAQIRTDNAALQAQQADAAADPDKLAQASDQLTMELRVFEDRRQSLSFACNVPTTIEQRLYALGQVIQAAM